MNKMNLKKYLVGGVIGALFVLAVGIPTTLLLNHQTLARSPLEISKPASSQPTTTTSTDQTVPGNSDNISLNEAKEKVLNHADVSSSQAIFTQANLEYDDGRIEYEIDFIADNKEYDYTIDANTGTITEYDVEGFNTY